ncbi:MAG: hypothetical protein NVSMB57_10330 [Actinomycetota bacterium]
MVTSDNMRRALLIMMLLLLAACSGGSTSASKDQSGRGPKGKKNKPPDVTLLAQNLTLPLGEPVVIGIDNAVASTSVIVTHDPDAHIDIYLLPSADARLTAACQVKQIERRDCVRDIGTGVRESLEARGTSAGSAVAILLRKGPPVVDVRLIYSERSRRLDVRIPRFAPYGGAAACADNACNPFFEMMPLRSGKLSARATFAGTAGRLQVQAGRVIGRSATATGIPYTISAERLGKAPLNVEAHVDASSEVALSLSNDDPAHPLTRVALFARWP